MATVKEQIVAAYEIMAERYNELIENKPHNAHYDRPNTLELITAPAGKTILDAACGPGKYAEILMARGAEITGFDLSPKMVELAKARNAGKGNFFVHDLASPLEVNSYRRPLSACLSPITDNGFYIDKLVEPKPTSAFEALDPKHFKELNAFPAFMCIRAVKR